MSQKMKIEEAIKIMQVAKAEIEWSAPLDYQEAFSIAIEALEKQIPKKFKIVDDCTPICPICGKEVWNMDWCNSCGQRLADEEED